MYILLFSSNFLYQNLIFSIKRTLKNSLEIFPVELECQRVCRRPSSSNNDGPICVFKRNSANSSLPDFSLESIKPFLFLPLGIWSQFILCFNLTKENFKEKTNRKGFLQNLMLLLEDRPMVCNNGKG